MITVFLAVLPVFLLIAVGMVLDRVHLLPESFAGHLSQYTLKIAMPCLLLRVVSTSDIELLSAAGFLVALLAAQSLVFGLGYVWLSRGLRNRTPATAIIALCGACSNSGFLGLPIVDSLLPGNHEALAAAGLACIMPPLALVCAQSLIEAQIKKGQSRNVLLVVARAVLLNPFVVATILGSCINMSGLGIWAPFDRVMSMIAATGAPCALIALGLDMWRKMSIARRLASPSRVEWQGFIVLAKLAVHPLLSWALMAALGVPGTWLAVGVLMAGTSTAVMAYVLAEVSGTVPEESALSLVITAFLSMFTIPAFALLLRASGYI